MMTEHDRAVTGPRPRRLWGRIGPLMLVAAAMTAALGGPAAAEAPLRAGAETLFVGGEIVTMNPAQPTAEALAVRDGVIVAVGRERDVRAWQAAETRVVDLQGRTLLPGFIEAHTHPLASAVMGAWVDVSGFTYPTAAGFTGALKTAVAAAKPGQWVIAFGYDPVIVRDLTTPSKAELDALAPDNPVMIVAQMMHLGFANSRAFAEVGITNTTPDPRGGAFVKDTAGELTGTIREAPALLQFTAGMPQQPRAAFRALVARQYRAYAASGYTSITAMGQVPLTRNYLRLLQEVADDPATPVRVYAYVFDAAMPGVPFGPGFGSEKFKLVGVKLLLDGSPYAGGMATREPYLHTPLTAEGMGLEPGARGHLNYTTDQLRTIVERYHTQGWQIAVHVQGERAVAQALEVFSDVLGRYPRPDHRHRLEHCALITDAQLQQAADLGLTTSFFINHVYYYGSRLRDAIVGPERASRFMPMTSAKKYGHRFTLHTDNPASPVGAFAAMQAAVTRRMRDTGEVLGPEQRITIDDALAAVTINAAWQIREEDRRGSLEVGKVADLTVVSRNPRTTPPDELHEIAVAETYLAGRRVMPAGEG